MAVESNPSRDAELLVVEDSPTQAEQLAHIIQAHGYRASIAGNGKEALAAMAVRKPTVVISDIVMPEMNGYELCRRIKTSEHFQHIPVILVTALSDPKDVLAGLECGADNFIVKPYDAEYLLSRIRYIIANRELRRRDTLDMGVEIVLGDRKYFINSARRQILDLLLSTYEAAVKKNGELSQAQHQLQAFAAQLESRVEERVKELTCLFNISRLVETAGQSLEQVLQGIAELIPPAMRYPASTAARITLDGAEFKTANYRDTPVMQSRPIVVHGQVAGRLDVSSLAEQSTTEEPFLEEECRLFTAITERAGHIVGRMRAEEEMRRLNVELEQRVHQRTLELATANAELEAFAYSVSHDLRAPLRHLDGFAQLLLKRAGEQLDETSVHCVDTIVEASAKMSQLIDDLLAFSRTGRVEIVKQAVCLQPLVSAVQEELVTANADRRLTWDIGPLPTVNADPALLRQVLVNLLSNAIKFTAPRSEGRIEIGATTNDSGEAVIYVRDNGVGFDPQYAHKLFGVFQRLHSNEQFEGTGIGLANVRRIIHRHGGRVWAEGAVDRGATFYFTLPQATAP